MPTQLFKEASPLESDWTEPEFSGSCQGSMTRRSDTCIHVTESTATTPQNLRQTSLPPLLAFLSESDPIACWVLGVAELRYPHH